MRRAKYVSRCYATRVRTPERSAATRPTAPGDAISPFGGHSRVYGRKIRTVSATDCYDDRRRLVVSGRSNRPDEFVELPPLLRSRKLGCVPRSTIPKRRQWSSIAEQPLEQASEFRVGIIGQGRTLDHRIDDEALRKDERFAVFQRIEQTPVPFVRLRRSSGAGSRVVSSTR